MESLKANTVDKDELDSKIRETLKIIDSNRKGIDLLKSIKAETEDRLSKREKMF